MTWNFWLSNIIQIWDSVLLLQGQCLSVIDCGKYTANSYVIKNTTICCISSQLYSSNNFYYVLKYLLIAVVLLNYNKFFNRIMGLYGIKLPWLCMLRHQTTSFYSIGHGFESHQEQSFFTFFLVIF